MKGALHRWVRRWWTGEAGALGALMDVLAAPLEAVYRWVVARRNHAWDRRGGYRVDGVRIVAFGNLTVGGTGKTPLAAWAARHLRDNGVRVVLLSRGYGRDELLLHARWNPEVPVLADPDRVRGAEKARGEGAQAVVLDDGFQHRRLARDADVVLLAAEDPFPGRLLPRGPYREATESLHRAHAVVVTRRTATEREAEGLAGRIGRDFPSLRVARAALSPGEWTDLGGAPADSPGGPILAVTSVARPESFARHVEAASGREADLMAFPDHHDFTEADARSVRARAGDRAVVVTEKDAVKLMPLAGHLGPALVLTQALRWEEGREALEQLVLGEA